ncbi:hypothetical protein LV779_12805, partial [Streptomyces thinghirensis]|nr:hypothetical protein [Streptomyces thinghirensis]
VLRSRLRISWTVNGFTARGSAEVSRNHHRQDPDGRPEEHAEDIPTAGEEQELPARSRPASPTAPKEEAPEPPRPRGHRLGPLVHRRRLHLDAGGAAALLLLSLGAIRAR